MENSPRPARVEFTPHAKPRSGPKLKPTHGPLALRSRSPCQAAMWPETEISPAASSRSRPQPGPGSGKLLPAWAESRSGDCEPSISIQRLREVFGRTKPRSTPSRNPSPHSDFLRPTHASQRSRATPSADEREQRERARGAALSPSLVCALTVG
jgi:hypothetical protein